METDCTHQKQAVLAVFLRGCNQSNPSSDIANIQPPKKNTIFY